jgi:hypothetical protein
MKELNKNTLTHALAQLPNYKPADSVWADIELQLTINELNTYQPPISIWDNLEKQLEFDENSLKNTQNTEGSLFELKSENSELQSLNTKLNTPIKSIKKRGLLRQLIFNKWAIAATLTGLIFTIFSLLKTRNTEGSDFNYSTEVVDNQLLKNNWDDAESDYKMVENFCQHQIAACETPAFKTLKQELDELNAAREAIKNAIGSFNSDADLMIQLKDIEQQRATILRQIVGVM